MIKGPILPNQTNDNFIILVIPAPISHRTPEENLGVGYLTSALRKNGYNVLILDGWLNGWSPDEIAKKILSGQEPIFVGVSAYQSNISQAIDILQKVKKEKNIRFIAGGFGPTFNPDLFLDSGFDFVIRGEAEESILEIAQMLQNNETLPKINNISYKKNGKTFDNELSPLKSTLDSLPYPSRDTVKLALEKNTPIHILTARGCSGNCTFCSIASFFKLSKTKKWRGRSINNIIQELEELKGLGVKHIKIIDDSFIDGDRNEKWCKEFAEQIKKNKLNFYFRASIRADKVTENIAYYLKEAGFFSFSCGIENFSETALQRMAKGANVIQNINALEIFKKYDYFVQAGQILFDPFTTMKELNENYKYMQKYNWIISKGIFTEMFAADGTPFQKTLLQKKLAEEHDSHLGNYDYDIQDPQAKAVYQALKKWHISHMGFYDKAIDPITSPKALTKQQMQDFYSIYQRIRSIDLSFMGKVLSKTENNTKQKNIINFVDEQILRHKPLFEYLEQLTDMLYKKHNLIYNAKLNPFIKEK